jgi:hypothetical protein
VPPSCRPAFRPQPHAALQPRPPRHDRQPRPSQPVNAAFYRIFPAQRHVHLAPTRSAATSRADSRDGRDGRGPRGCPAAVPRRTAHRRRPGQARDGRPSTGTSPPPSTRTSPDHHGPDPQPAAGADAGRVGMIPATGACVPQAPNGHGHHAAQALARSHVSRHERGLDHQTPCETGRTAEASIRDRSIQQVAAAIGSATPLAAAPWPRIRQSPTARSLASVYWS